MPIYSLTEFAKLCGRKKPHVSQDAGEKRGKVIYNKDGNIDSSDPVNAAYLAKWQALTAGANEGGETIQVPPALTPKVTKHTEAFQVQVSETDIAADNTLDSNGDFGIHDLPTGNLTSLQTLQKRLDAAKTKKDIEKLQLQIDKLNGILIPTEPTVAVVIHVVKEFQTAFKHSGDNLITEFAVKFGLTSEEKAEFRTALINTINKATEEGIKSAKNGIGNIVNDYSQSRGKGERKAV